MFKASTFIAALLLFGSLVQAKELRVIEPEVIHQSCSQVVRGEYFGEARALLDYGDDDLRIYNLSLPFDSNKDMLVQVTALNRSSAGYRRHIENKIFISVTDMKTSRVRCMVYDVGGTFFANSAEGKDLYFVFGEFKIKGKTLIFTGDGYGKRCGAGSVTAMYEFKGTSLHRTKQLVRAEKCEEE